MNFSTFLSRIDFVPCNRPDHFVIEIHVKAGEPSEIYSDRLNKVNSLCKLYNSFRFCKAVSR